MFEQFPYANFHELNMDWIIKIAKDFLDQYTHIQETINSGLESLDNKATELEALLQAWYDTHSDDIAEALANALQDISDTLQQSLNTFNTEADAKAQQVLDSLPDDYTTLAANMEYIKKTAISLYNTTENYAPKNEIPNGNNTWYEFPINITKSKYPVYFTAYNNSGEESYMNVELYNGATRVWQAVSDIFGFLDGETRTYQIPANITANKVRVLNRNGRSGLSFSITSTANSHISDDEYYNKLHYLNSSGLRPKEISALVYAGATTSNNTIVIPAGSTGLNSYFTVSFPWQEINKYTHANQEAVFIIAVDSTTDMNNIQPLIFNANRGTAGTQAKLLTVMNNTTYVYQATFMLQDTYGTSDEFMYFQIKPTAAMTSNVTLRYVNSWLSWEAYSQSIFNKLPSLTNNPYTLRYNIEAGGSLRSVLEQAERIANKYNPVVVEYYGWGQVYDLSGDITASELTTASTYKGLTVPPYVTLKGMGGWQQNHLSLTLPSTLDAAVRNRISAINLEENAQLENLWFTGKNCRYTCHDDTQTYNPEWTLKTVKNCKFTSDYTTFHRAYGAGLQSGVNWKFIDCIFENLEGAEFGNAAFSVHNNLDIIQTPSITFINCQFSGGQGVTLESLNRHSTTSVNLFTNVAFYGCKAVNLVWQFPIICTMPEGDKMEYTVTGCGNSFNKNEVRVYITGTFTHEFDDQISVWGKVTD